MSEAGEFQIIEQFFTYPSFGAWKSQGVGDDCAIIDTGAGRLAVTCDMTALGTHFFPDADPDASLQKEKNFQLPVPVGGDQASRIAVDVSLIRMKVKGGVFQFIDFFSVRIHRHKGAVFDHG